jgi:predicted permease
MWARLWSFARAAFGRRRFERDMDEELRFHVERYAEDLERGGTPRHDALRQAHRELGAVAALKRDCRQPIGLVLLDRLSYDLGQALRTLRGGTSWTAAAMLAIAISLTTATFSVLDALLLRPVPFRDADRLAYLSLADKDGSRFASWPVRRAWEKSGIFDAVGGTWWGGWSMVIETDAGPLVRPGDWVTPGTLELLGVRPLAGRTFNEHDGRAGRVIVISEDLWTHAFERDGAIVGRPINVDGEDVVVIGVVPRSFRFPDAHTEIWRLLLDGATFGSWESPAALVRFRSGVPPDETLRLATEIAHQTDASTRALSVVRDPVAGRPAGSQATQAMRLIAGGVLLVFLALCANAAGLSLTRFNQRRRQFALCSALGASRGRLIAQAMSESALIGAAGTAIGVVLAAGLVTVTRAVLPGDFLEWSLHRVALDTDALIVAAVIATVATLLSGLLPAVVATRLDTQSSLRLVEHGGTESRAARALGRTLVVIEIAMASALLVPALLVIRSFLNLDAIDRGFDTSRLSVLQVNLDNTLASGRPARVAVERRAVEALEALPGVERVSWSLGVPTVENTVYSGSDWRADTPGARPTRLNAVGMSVGRDFFEVYGIPLLAGRLFQPDDDARRVVIDERIAAVLWPKTNPVGRFFTWNDNKMEVIGVVRSVYRQRRGDPPTLYSKFEPGGPYATATLRCIAACPPEAIVRRELGEAVPALRVGWMDRLDDRFAADLATPRLTASVTTVFASISIIAAAGGLFSVLSYTVGRRRREFGIRAALGASSGSIGSLVLREACGLSVLGLGIGALAAWMLANALAALQYGVTIADPLSWAIVIGLLAAGTLLSAWRPARTAMRADPAQLLREE